MQQDIGLAAASETDLVGYDVQALDGSIGRIDEAPNAADFIVVDTGRWFFAKSKRVMLPHAARRALRTGRRWLPPVERHAVGDLCAGPPARTSATLAPREL